MPYAERTSVPVENTKAKIERTPTRHDADRTQDWAGVSVYRALEGV
jgi:hypothetical protein